MTNDQQLHTIIERLEQSFMFTYLLSNRQILADLKVIEQKLREGTHATKPG